MKTTLNTVFYYCTQNTVSIKNYNNSLIKEKNVKGQRQKKNITVCDMCVHVCVLLVTVFRDCAGVLQTRLRLTSAPSQCARSMDASVYSISRFAQCTPSTAHNLLHASHSDCTSPLTSGFCTGANSWRGLVGGKPQVVKSLNWLWLC